MSGAILSLFATGIDYTATKHSIQRGGLVDTMFRVRSASLVKMVNLGHRSDYKVLATGH